MSRFRQSESRTVPGLNTAALPDLIFTILFFFMIVTHMRPVPVKTQFDLPQATELQKLEEKSGVIYIMVGKQQGEEDTESIQLNSDFVSLEEMPAFLTTIKEQSPSVDDSERVVVLKADKETPMELISAIKQHLRNAGLLTIFYSADKES